MTLRERALAANEQRDQVAEQKQLLRLKESVQKIIGETVNPISNSVVLDGYEFFMKNSGFSSDQKLYVRSASSDLFNDGWEVSSLADFGEAIVMYESPDEPEEDVPSEN